MQTEDNFIERMGTFDSQGDFNELEKLKRTIHSMAHQFEYDERIKYILVYIAGIEDNKDIENLILSCTNDFAAYPEFNISTRSAFDMVTADKDLTVLNKSVKYAIETRNLALLRYVLNGADNLFLNASIKDEQILDILDDLNDET